MAFNFKPQEVPEFQSAIWKGTSDSARGCFVKDVDGGIDFATASTDIIIGVADTEGASANEACRFYPMTPGKVVLVKASAAIAVLAKLTATTGGKAVTLTPAATKIITGIALQAATAANDLIAMRIFSGYTSA